MGFGIMTCKWIGTVMLIDRNIGRFSTIATGLTAGLHRISCEVVEETSDSEGRHEFRMISIMRCV
jgi:hypothetical protein